MYPLNNLVMNEENPYITPETKQPESNMRSKQLKKLYLRSANLGTIAVLLIIGTLAYFFLLYIRSAVIDSTTAIIWGALGCFNLISAIALFKRPSWGKVCGIISCVLMLINIPIGTIIGIAGLVAISKSPELFGSRRFLHKDLKVEYKLRKREKRL